MKNRFLISLFIIGIFYWIIFWLLDDGPIYIIGGGILGTVKEFIKDDDISYVIGVGVWGLLIILSSVIYNRSQIKVIKYFLLIALFFLFFLVDFIFLDLLTYDTLFKRYFYVASSILIKSVVLSLIFLKRS